MLTHRLGPPTGRWRCWSTSSPGWPTRKTIVQSPGVCRTSVNTLPDGGALRGRACVDRGHRRDWVLVGVGAVAAHAAAIAIKLVAAAGRTGPDVAVNVGTPSAELPVGTRHVEHRRWLCCCAGPPVVVAAGRGSTDGPVRLVLGVPPTDVSRRMAVGATVARVTDPARPPEGEVIDE